MTVFHDVSLDWFCETCVPTNEFSVMSKCHAIYNTPIIYLPNGDPSIFRHFSTCLLLKNLQWWSLGWKITIHWKHNLRLGGSSHGTSPYEGGSKGVDFWWIWPQWETGKGYFRKISPIGSVIIMSIYRYIQTAHHVWVNCFGDPGSPSENGNGTLNTMRFKGDWTP